MADTEPEPRESSEPGAPDEAATPDQDGAALAHDSEQDSAALAHDSSEQDAAARDGRIRRTRRRVEQTRRDLAARATDIEERVPAARSVVHAYEHDRAVGGEIMAGAIAFRAFVFILPLVLVLVTALGLASNLDGAGTKDVAKQAGITGLAAQSVSASATTSNAGRWITLAIGLIALYSTSIALARALRIAHALAWRRQVAPMKRTWRAALIVTGAALGMTTLVSLISRLDAAAPLAGLIVAILSIFIYAGVWLGISFLLPHGDAPWPALLPGAVLVGAGVLVLHLVTVYYVAAKISKSSEFYGPLGGAIAILGWLYLVGRLTVSSAVLNASLYDAREP